MNSDDISVSSFGEKDFQLPDLDVIDAADFGTTKYKKRLRYKINLLNNEILKELNSYNKLDDLLNNSLNESLSTSSSPPRISTSPNILSSTQSSSHYKRNLKKNLSEGEAELKLIHNVIENNNKMDKKKLIKVLINVFYDKENNINDINFSPNQIFSPSSTSSLPPLPSSSTNSSILLISKDNRINISLYNKYYANITLSLNDYEEYEEEYNESTLNHPRLGSIEEKKEDLRQELIEKYCKKKGLKYNEKYTNKEKRKLRLWFKAMDYDNSGEVDVEELQDPLISSGILKTKEQIIRVLNNVDNNQTGGIDFNEFLLALSYNKLADSMQIKKLQAISNNEFFGTDTLINIERRKKLIKSIIKKNNDNMNEIDELYKKYSNTSNSFYLPNTVGGKSGAPTPKNKVSSVSGSPFAGNVPLLSSINKEKENFEIELEKLEEKQAHSNHLHGKYINSINNIIQEKKKLYVKTSIKNYENNFLTTNSSTSPSNNNINQTLELNSPLDHKKFCSIFSTIRNNSTSREDCVNKLKKVVPLSSPTTNLSSISYSSLLNSSSTLLNNNSTVESISSSLSPISHKQLAPLLPNVSDYYNVNEMELNKYRDNIYSVYAPIPKKKKKN